jgi:proteasome accessory factor A
MSKKVLFGFENEYGWSGHSHMVVEVLGQAGVKYLHGMNTHDAFLSNGARLYLDCHHPEYGTPECDNPNDLVRHVLAGEALLRDLAKTIKSLGHGEQRAFRHNVDYSSKTTWGAHESYLVDTEFHNSGIKVIRLLPFLVTRIVMTGAGGFDATCPGLRFTLSPRAHYMVATVSGESTAGRGIFNTRREALSEGFQRLHVLCGESLCSETSLWLKAATTAMVVSLINQGVELDILGGGWMDEWNNTSVQWMKDIAVDPSLSTKKFGMTAVEVQRKFLAAAWDNMDKLPDWAEGACDVWWETLEKLDEGEAGKTLDWAVKYALYGAHIRRRGFDWEVLEKWNKAADLFSLQMGRSRNIDLSRNGGDGDDWDRQVLQVLESEAVAGAASLSWLKPAMHKELVKLRYEMLAMDEHFGEITGGLFESLAPALSHSMELGDVSVARSTPPPGRATARGGEIAKLSGTGGDFSADWSSISHSRTELNRVMEMPNPFSDRRAWTSIPIYRGIYAGSIVKLGGSDADCTPRMMRYIGLKTKVLGIIGRDNDGMIVAQVEADRGENAWRVDRMEAIEPGDESFDIVPGDVVELNGKFCVFCRPSVSDGRIRPFVRGYNGNFATAACSMNGVMLANKKNPFLQRLPLAGEEVVLVGPRISNNVGRISNNNDRLCDYAPGRCEYFGSKARISEVKASVAILDGIQWPINALWPVALFL